MPRKQITEITESWLEDEELAKKCGPLPGVLIIISVLSIIVIGFVLA